MVGYVWIYRYWKNLNVFFAVKLCLKSFPPLNSTLFRNNQTPSQAPQLKVLNQLNSINSASRALQLRRLLPANQKKANRMTSRKQRKDARSFMPEQRNWWNKLVSLTNVKLINWFTNHLHFLPFTNCRNDKCKIERKWLKMLFGKSVVFVRIDILKTLCVALATNCKNVVLDICLNNQWQWDTFK